MAIVDLDDFKTYIRVENTIEDDMIENLLAAAENAAANWCRVDFDASADEQVKNAIMMYAGYNYEHRSEPDEKGYKAMYQAFQDMLSPYAAPEKLF